MARRVFRAAVVVVMVAGCNGFITDAPAEGPEGPGGPGRDCVSEDSCPEVLRTGPSPLRRLTRAQYDGAVLDALELTTLPAGATAALVPVLDGQEGLFASTTRAAESAEVSAYIEAGEAIAAALSAAKLAALAGCELDMPDCADALVATVGRRLFRRPLSGEEAARYRDLFDEMSLAFDDVEAARVAVATMLASPSFLYREERVADEVVGRVRMLTDVAFASRLSFFLWQSGPDEELLAVAETGALSDPAERDAQVARLLADPRAERAVRDFGAAWSGYDHLEDAEVDPALADDMREETERFFANVVLEGDARLDTLMTADYSFVSPELAAHYGIAPPTDASGYVTLPPERVGILTHGGVLAANGKGQSEILRGKFVRERVLCAPILSFPVGLVPDESADRLTPGSACIACHDRMDRLGWGFEDFDATGAFRPDEAMAVTPELVADAPQLDELAGEFADHHELVERLVGSEAVEDCMATQWFRYAFGRFATTDDAPTVAHLQESFRVSGGDIRALMMEIARTPAFRARSVDDFANEEGEGR